MSERIYRLVLRLYPGQFRRSYGEEALLLFRDRMRDETGGWRRLWLWLDLLMDLGALHLRGYHESAVVGAPAAAGQVSFASLDEGAMELRYVVWGGLLSLVFCGGALFALEHGGGHLPPDWTVASKSGFVVKPKMTPRIVFSYVPEGGREGSGVRLRAVLRAGDEGPVPTGKVNFLYGWNVLVSGTLVDGVVTIDAKVPAGEKLPLTALYLGDGNYRSISSLEKVE